MKILLNSGGSIDDKLGMDEIYEAFLEHKTNITNRVNLFARETLRTRGGRIGSGLGTLIEALWGYYANQEFHEKNFEVAWIPDNQFNDFAVIRKNVQWNHTTGENEFFRIEAKSMNLDADESKGHFDELEGNMSEHDLLLVIVWRWVDIDDFGSYPEIVDSYVGNAKKIAQLRDALHIERKGTFVDGNNCPDNCNPTDCTHHGEPLNEQGKRERRYGPESRKPNSASYAANFGGLVRMLKTSSNEARNTFKRKRSECDIAHEYISFIHKNLPSEEVNQYQASDWKTVARNMGVDTKGMNKSQIIEAVKTDPNYRNKLKELD